jgi:hypothetical protein
MRGSAVSTNNRGLQISDEKRRRTEPRLLVIDKTADADRGALYSIISQLLTECPNKNDMSHNALKERRRSDYKFQLEYRTRW